MVSPRRAPAEMVGSSKRCLDCGELKDMKADFYFYAYGPGECQPYCRPCQKARIQRSVAKRKLKQEA